MRLFARRPLRPLGCALFAVLVAITGCASHHNPSMGHAAAADESAAPAVIPTSCEPGDTGCSCVDVDLTDYDRACDVASDCVAITAGTMCGAGSCFGANAAVNADSYPLWSTDRQPVEYASCVPTTSGAVACVRNACVLQYPLSDGGTETSSGPGSGASGASGAAGGSDDGVYIDLGDDDDDTSADGGSTATSGDDDDSSPSGDDDDDDDNDASDSKHRPRGHASDQEEPTRSHSAAVTDTVK